MACGLAGPCNPRMLFNEGYKDDCIRFCLRMMQTGLEVHEEFRKKNGGVTQGIIIVDCKGVQFRNCIGYDCTYMVTQDTSSYLSRLEFCFYFNHFFYFSDPPT